MADCNDTLKAVLPAIAISLVAKLTEEMTNVFADAGTEKENVPSASDEVPIFVPFTITDALGTAAPFSSVTLPLRVRVCA